MVDSVLTIGLETSLQFIYWHYGLLFAQCLALSSPNFFSVRNMSDSSTCFFLDVSETFLVDRLEIFSVVELCHFLCSRCDALLAKLLVGLVKTVCGNELSPTCSLVVVSLSLNLLIITARTLVFE